MTMSSQAVQSSWKCQPSDLDLPNATPIGAGALSYVLRAKHIPTGAMVAVKVLSKVQLLQQSKVDAVMSEKSCLYDLGPHPYIARLIGTAQSDDELYFVLEHLGHGDLLQHIRTVSNQRLKRRNELIEKYFSAADCRDNAVGSSPAYLENFRRCMTFNDIRLVTAQLVLALEHTFRKGYVLRDLKPENICFDDAYRCCLIDFDTVTKDFRVPHTNHGKAVKPSESAAQRAAAGRRLTVSDIQGMRRMTAQFCGTAQYVSPEMVGECTWSYSSDLWALGVIVYQMLYGVYPFRGDNTFAVMRKLIQGVQPEKHFVPPLNLTATDDELVEEALKQNEEKMNAGASCPKFESVKSFISSLLRVDPTIRIGVDPLTLKFDVMQLKAHSLFRGFDWGVVDNEIASFRFVDPEAYLRAQAQRQAMQDVDHLPPHQDTPMTGIAARLDQLPVHSEEYASFVHRASNDVNPFEEWAHRALDSPTHSKQSDAGASQEEENNSESDTAKSSSSESSCSDDDVIDDVGMQDIRGADADFRDA